jgi:hypothetical protein
MDGKELEASSGYSCHSAVVGGDPGELTGDDGLFLRSPPHAPGPVIFLSPGSIHYSWRIA